MKQLIILSCIIPYSNTHTAASNRTMISELNHRMNEIFSQELQDETNTVIKWIIIPINNGDSQTQAKVECIYPVAERNDNLTEKILNYKDNLNLF